MVCKHKQWQQLAVGILTRVLQNICMNTSVICVKLGLYFSVTSGLVSFRISFSDPSINVLKKLWRIKNITKHENNTKSSLQKFSEIEILCSKFSFLVSHQTSELSAEKADLY